MKYLVAILCAVLACQISYADLKTKKIAKNIEFSYEDGVYPENIYQEDVTETITKDYTSIIAFCDFGNYTRQLPFEDFTSINEAEKYELLYNQDEKEIVFRRSIINRTTETWTPGKRSKRFILYLIK